jgi:hypothetical protein
MRRLVVNSAIDKHHLTRNPCRIRLRTQNFPRTSQYPSGTPAFPISFPTIIKTLFLPRREQLTPHHVDSEHNRGASYQEARATEESRDRGCGDNKGSRDNRHEID